MPPEITKDLQHILAFVAEKDAVNEAERSILFVISSGKIDRDNERIDQDGLADAIKAFAKNPAALACHLHRLDNGRSPVIGSWDTDSFVKRTGYCQMRLRFAETELGEEYWQLYRARHMRAVSIGFIPLEWHEEKTEKTGRIFVIDKLELLEISCVPVGCNREALSKVKGLFENLPVAGQLRETEGLTKKDVTDIVAKEIKTCLAPLSEQIEEVKDMLADSRGFAEELMLGSNSESSVSDGRDLTDAQILDAVKTAVTNLLKENYN